MNLLFPARKAFTGSAVRGGVYAPGPGFGSVGWVQPPCHPEVGERGGDFHLRTGLFTGWAHRCSPMRGFSVTCKERKAAFRGCI